MQRQGLPSLALLQYPRVLHSSRVRSARSTATNLRVATRVTRLLGAWVALSVAILPMVPNVHLAFSSHRHAFCSEHGVLEHIPHAARSNDAVTFTTDPPSSTWSRGLVETPGFASHHFCYASICIASFWTARAPIFDAPMTKAVVSLDDRGQGLTALDLILLAPKQSPPRFSAV